MHFYKKTNNKKYLEVVEKLLLSISSRGIYDHLEGGVSRYTVDEKWIVPHFEKMLYDNIQYVNLLNNYLNEKDNNYLKHKIQQTINFINSNFLQKIIYLVLHTMLIAMVLKENIIFGPIKN